MLAIEQSWDSPILKLCHLTFWLLLFHWKAMLEKKIVIVNVGESQPSFSQIECNLTCHSDYVSFHVKRLRAYGIFLQQSACTIDWKIKVNSTGTLGIIEFTCKATWISFLNLCILLLVWMSFSLSTSFIFYLLALLRRASFWTPAMVYISVIITHTLQFTYKIVSNTSLFIETQPEEDFYKSCN